MGDEMDVILGTQFRGIEQAKEYQKTLEAIDKATRSLQSRAVFNPPTPPGGVNYERAREAFRQTASNIPPLLLGGNSKDREKLKEKFQDAVSRGGLADLASKSMPEIGSIAKFSKLAGWVGVAATAFEAAAKEIYSFTDAASKATMGIVSSQAALGSTLPQAVQVKLLGVAGADASKASAFQQRITTDPLAMGAAGSLGIANLKDPYGDRNHATRYLSAIEQVSAIGDEAQRKRLANVLGIEEEVTKYMLLSARTRQALKSGSVIGAGFNDTKAQRAAAEFMASTELMKQANENLTTAIGQGFLPEVKGVIDLITGAENATASTIRAMSTRYRQIRDEAGGTLDLIRSAVTNPIGMFTTDPTTYGKAFEELKAGFTGTTGDLVKNRRAERLGMPEYGALIGGDGRAPDYSRQVSSLDANTEMLANVSQALARLDKNIGLSNRSREAVDRLRTFGGATQFSLDAQRQFTMGALG